MQTRPLIVALVPLLAACATTGATFRSGVGDKFLDHAPYYAGAKPELVARDTGRIAHLPISFQRDVMQSSISEQRQGADSTQLQRLLIEMNAYLDSLGVSARLGSGSAGVTQASGAVQPASVAVAPDVQFGCVPALGIAGNECAERAGGALLGRRRQTMKLAVGRPSAEWTTWMQGALADAGASRTLVITLEVADYLPREEGLLGHKVLELGTGNVTKLPWLTSLETPVSVLQVTGAVVDKEGKAVRIGAEGFYAHRTRLLVSAVGAQEVLRDDDVKAARALRRDDLPGQPLAWQVALRELATRLTGK